MLRDVRRPVADSCPALPDDVVSRATTGDPTAIGRVLGIVQPLVVRYCRGRLGRTSVSADDIAQDVCLAVLTALPGFRVPGRPFLAFAYGIAAHKVIDAHRAASRERADPVADLPDTVEAVGGPEERALRGELSDELGRLLDTLPRRQREVLVLRVALGLTAEETATAVGSTPGAVRVAQHRALARLREAL
jgi:RNA polymerase sigma-70 factor (ECF subfamily)